MFVLDTSAYVNGHRDHFPYKTFPSVWQFLEDPLRDKRIMLPRSVYDELHRQDDDVSTWIASFENLKVTPGQAVQELAGEIQQHIPNSHLRHDADPFIIAEAKHRGFTVVTYEGRSFRGVPTAPTKWARSMPGICKRFDVPCRTLPEALGQLGAVI